MQPLDVKAFFFGGGGFKFDRKLEVAFRLKWEKFADQPWKKMLIDQYLANAFGEGNEAWRPTQKIFKIYEPLRAFDNLSINGWLKREGEMGRELALTW